MGADIALKGTHGAQEQCCSLHLNSETSSSLDLSARKTGFSLPVQSCHLIPREWKLGEPCLQAGETELPAPPIAG